MSQHTIIVTARSETIANEVREAITPYATLHRVAQMTSCSAAINNNIHITTTIVLERTDEAVNEVGTKMMQLLDTLLGRTTLATRTVLSLRRASIHTVLDLINQTESKLLQYRGIRAITLNEIKEWLSSQGLYLRVETD